MGVVKDGTVSGVLPAAEVFAVHYPGYPSSTSRAIETLGGMDGIVKTRSSLSNYLELHFRPEDPYSHPAFGELRPCSSLLLRLSTKKPTGNQDGVISEKASKYLGTGMSSSDPLPCFTEAERNRQQSALCKNKMPHVREDNGAQPHEQAVSTQLCADILARVVQAYHFDGMVDYQHVLAVHADVARRRKRHWVEPHFEKGGLMDIDQEGVMILVPPLFSPKDIPEKLVLRPSINSNLRQKQEVVRQRWEMDIGQSFALDFNIEEIPQKINWEDKIPKGSTDWEWQMAISKLFDERPIWIRRSLHDRLIESGVKASIDQLKRLLLRTAYYFATGPFRAFLIKNGYDPRKDPESRIYQRVDFRIPPPLRNTEDMGATGKVEHTWKAICAFRAFPCKSFTSLQLFELDDDYIQQEIRKPTRQTTCTRSTGWLSKSRFHRLKLCVTVRFLSLLSSKDAKDLMKAALERLEKSKKLHVLQNDLGPNEEGPEHVDKDPNYHGRGVPEINSTGTALVGGNDKDEAYDDEAEDDEDEEEELEEDALQHGDGGHGSFSLQTNPDLVGGNITKNYLQKLLGNSPFTEVSKDFQSFRNVHNDDTSDGEYQIYEQDSDENAAYFDDDEDAD